MEVPNLAGPLLLRPSELRLDPLGLIGEASTLASRFELPLVTKLPIALSLKSLAKCLGLLVGGIPFLANGQTNWLKHQIQQHPEVSVERRAVSSLIMPLNPTTEISSLNSQNLIHHACWPTMGGGPSDRSAEPTIQIPSGVGQFLIRRSYWQAMGGQLSDLYAFAAQIHWRGPRFSNCGAPSTSDGWPTVRSSYGPMLNQRSRLVWSFG